MSKSIPWSNKGRAFETEEGVVQRQTRRNRDGVFQQRLRVTLAGSPAEESVYLDPEELMPLANLLDDTCDAAEDGEFYVGWDHEEPAQPGA